MDVFSALQDWTELGLPKVAKGKGPYCSGLAGTPVCSEQDIIQELSERPPVYNPFASSPSYSNLGYTLLGIVVERATGRTFEQLAQSWVFNPIGMKSTSFNGSEGIYKNGFVPFGDPTWNGTLGAYEPAGGMFSSTHDVIALGNAILTSKVLPVATTRQWLKPITHTASFGMSVGAPWEILRGHRLTSDGRVVDVYTKTGDLGLYHADLSLVPDYGLVISYISGGPELSADDNIRDIVNSDIVKAFVAAAEEVGKEEAKNSGYSGTFTDADSKSSITLEFDNGPGLSIAAFTVRGIDYIKYYDSYSLSPPSGTSPKVRGRIYPTDLTAAANGNTQVAWRAIWDKLSEKEETALNKDLFYYTGNCNSWFFLDNVSYDLKTLAGFVFNLDSKGNVVSIVNPAFNVTMTKSK